MNTYLLAIDVGNTSTVLGLLDQNDHLLHSWRIRTARDLLPDNYAMQIKNLLELSKAPAPHAAIISSVAPPVGANIQKALTQYWNIPALEVGVENLQVSIEIKEPKAVGADRLVNMVGVQHYLESSPFEYALVVDFGTATTFDAVARGNRFLGGVIAPGPATAADSLFSATAKLPRVALVAPPKALGGTTVEAIQSGLVFGYAEMVDGMVRRLSLELPAKPLVIATGGFARTLEGICTQIDLFDDDVTLRGLVRIWRSFS